MSYVTRNSNRIDQLGRSSVGRINQDCCCNMHYQWTFGETFKVFDIKRNKKFKKNVVTYLREEKLLGRKSNYLCTGCSEAVENILTNKNMLKMESKQISNEDIRNIDDIEETDIGMTEERPSLNQETEELVDFLINLLNDSNISARDVPYAKWAKLISLILHKIVNPKIYDEGKSISTMYKCPSILANLDFIEYF